MYNENRPLHLDEILELVSMLRDFLDEGSGYGGLLDRYSNPWNKYDNPQSRYDNPRDNDPMFTYGSLSQGTLNPWGHPSSIPRRVMSESDSYADPAFWANRPTGQERKQQFEIAQAQKSALAQAQQYTNEALHRYRVSSGQTPPSGYQPAAGWQSGF